MLSVESSERHFLGHHAMTSVTELSLSLSSVGCISAIRPNIFKESVCIRNKKEDRLLCF